MKRFRNILLVYESDPATRDRAAALVKDNSARLTVIQVIKEMPEGWQKVQLGEMSLDLEKLALREYRAQLKEFVEPLKQRGLRASTKTLVGTPFVEIIREVIGYKRDLVIITAEGKGGLKERLFGSTSLHLMRKCPCPVWVMKPTRRRRFSRILAAVDPDPSDKVRDSLNTTILQLASSLATRDRATLHIVHAWTAFGEHLLRGRVSVPESEVDRFVQEEKQRHRARLDALVAKHTDGTARIHFIKWHAPEVISRLATSEKIDLLVMGTVSRTGIAGLFIGNTAEKILDEVDCSVLTVKPQGFVSPVQLA